jgi:glyoxylase-like metal-dependent hydrolase (beta-lactamase superfamily II)
LADSQSFTHPDHTPGSVSLYDPERKVLFVGDTIRFANGKISGQQQRFTLDMQQASQSVKKISRLDFDLMLSGHGDPLKPNASEKVKELSESLEGTSPSNLAEKCRKHAPDKLDILKTS